MSLSDKLLLFRVGTDLVGCFQTRKRISRASSLQRLACRSVLWIILYTFRRPDEDRPALTRAGASRTDRYIASDETQRVALSVLYLPRSDREPLNSVRSAPLARARRPPRPLLTRPAVDRDLRELLGNKVLVRAPAHISIRRRAAGDGVLSAAY